MSKPGKQPSSAGEQSGRTSSSAAENEAPTPPDPDATICWSEEEKQQMELADAKKRTQLAQADFENYRKRMEREQQQERKYASMRLLRDLLPVLDNMQRAIEAAEQTEESDSLLEGFKLVAQQLQTMLAQHNCEPIVAVGEPFDPNLHEAVSQMPSEEYPADIVMVETAVGYLLHDRVVRPSQVIVSTGSPQKE